MAELIAPHDAVSRLRQARQDARAEWLNAGRIVRYYNGQQGVPYTPPSATPEYRQLQRRSITNVTRLASGVMAAGLHVDGIVPADLELNPTDEQVAAAAVDNLEAAIEHAAGWRYWQAAQLDSGQSLATLRAVVLGYANVVSWVTDPGELGNENGAEQLVEVRSLNPLTSWASFLDVEDDHPEVLIRRLGGKAGLANGSALWEVWAFDDAGGYRVELDERDGSIRKEWRHDLGHLPVTRLVGNRDLEGNPEGKVTPLRAAQDRLNEAVFSLLMAQTFQSFRQRWAVGVKDLSGVNPGVDRIIHTEGTRDAAQFGEFSAADLANIVKAVESALGTFAALAQIPPQNVLGLPSNIGPEALAAAEAGHTRDRANWQRNLSRGWLEVTRDVGALAGDDDVAGDYGAQVHWTTTESRSFAQVVDGLVKLTSGDRPILPVDVAIELVPGLTQTDRRRALRLLAQQEPTGLAAVGASAAAGLLPNLGSLGLGGGGVPAGPGGALT